MVSWTRSTQPLLLGRPAWMKRWRAPSAVTAAPKSRALEFARDAVQQLAGVPRARVAL
jgi:hypothetical protein